jgi:hypothetical protein
MAIVQKTKRVRVCNIFLSLLIPAGYLSDSDEEGFCPDRERITDNPDEIEESEHLQHLKEVYQVEDFGSEDEFEEEEEVEVEAGETDGTTYVSPWEWHWGMSLEERWAAIYGFLEAEKEFLSHVLARVLSREIASTRRKYRIAKLKANSSVYDRAEVIGGTIVGCCTRLEAIRLTNPFAVLVEEASEVLEPLLFACIVPTTHKLELIGDHLQLQPALLSKFDFERCNKLNISMFERLIRGPNSSSQFFGVPSTVLSVQRRMRKSICDLTRSFYTDITEIIDHKVCHTKTIPLTRSPGMELTCQGGGREVPGVLPHIFFWTHQGAQGRAAVGISRVNQTEATMICNLAKYLVSCQVPKTSIAILTPYKGQLMLMKKMLEQEKLYAFNSKDNNQAPRPSVRLSTVDRFQGDEADIVLISLVIDAASKTNFVKLQNRMIVLLSRARIGMYVAGNLGYFKETNSGCSHWNQTFALLHRPATSDTTFPDDSPCETFSGIQIGERLEICCPQHRSSTKSVKGAAAPKLGFCQVPCDHQLPCGHSCGLNCHWPRSSHNTACTQPIAIPCTRHPKNVPCHCLPWGGHKDLAAATQAYKCTKQVSTELPCGHTGQFPCHEEVLLTSGRKPWPSCTKPSDIPFVHEACKHQLPCTCAEYQKWTANPTLVSPCSEMVSYLPACGHSVTVKCTMKQQYEKGQTFLCKQQVDVSLPRCGHKVRVACPRATSLQSWKGNPGAEPGIVREGGQYGPKDDICKQTVKFIRSCGHEETHSCEEAFDLAQNPTPCRFRQAIVLPGCGHKGFLLCYQKSLCDSGAKISTFISCEEKVVLPRACGHEIEVPCRVATSGGPKDPCTESIEVRHPLCGHEVFIKCSKSKFHGWEPWSKEFQNSPDYDLLMGEGIVSEVCRPTPPPKDLGSLTCKAMITLRRNCGHEIRAPCHEVFKHLLNQKAMPVCTVTVKKPLRCNHLRELSCQQYHAYLSDKLKINCQESAEKQCWNFAVCHQTVKAPCSSTEVPSCRALSEWNCPAGHTFSFQQCTKGTPSACPDCLVGDINQQINKMGETLASEGFDPSAFLKLDAPQIPNPGGIGVEKLPLSLDDAIRLVQAQTSILESYKVWCEKQDPFKRPLLKPYFVPCYALIVDATDNPLHPDLAAETLGGFGIIAEPWTGKSLQRLASSLTVNQDNSRGGGARGARGGRGRGRGGGQNRSGSQSEAKIEILFGYGYTCRPLSASSIPKKKLRWLTTQQEMGYDCVTVQDGRWIFWYPFCIYPTHRLTLTQSSLHTLVRDLRNVSLNLEPSLITFSQPKVLPQAQPRVKTPPATALLNTPAKQLGLALDWDTLSFGVECQFEQSIERELQRKLAFASKAFPERQKRDASPFAGINYIKGLSEGDGSTVYFELHLHQCLEYLEPTWADTCKVQATEALQKYIDEAVKRGADAHPLILLAISRYEDRSSKKMECLKTFIEMYPEATAWLTEKEAALFDGTTTAPRASQAVKTPLHKWEELKRKERCSSVAMEDLLKLTGLRVKEYAISLFSNAIAFNKMPPEIRKKNSTLTLNFCFVGNPGTGKLSDTTK